MTKELSPKRPTIGVIINEFEGVFHTKVREGLEKKAREYDVNLFYISGKALNSPYEADTSYNAIYNLFDKELFQGLIVTSGSLANFCEVEELQKLIKPYLSLPTVSLSLIIPGVPSIITNNRAGIREALVHLIEEHHYRRIGFIKGTEHNKDAIERFEAYCETLAFYKIPYDANLVYSGDFCFPTGAAAIKTFFDERQVATDAILSANDDMAHGAFVELKRRGIAIPSSVAIMGYDDIEAVRNLTPPLTTVAQPLVEQGMLAVQYVLDMIDQKEVPEVTELPSRLILRESCGCLPYKIHEPKYAKPHRASLDFHAFINNFIETNVHFKDPESLKDAYTGLIEDITKNASEEGVEGFLITLNKKLQQTIDDGGSVLFWQEALAYIRRNRCLLGELSDLDELFYKAQVLIGEAICRQESNRRLPIYHILWSMRNFVTQSNALLRMRDLGEALRYHLPLFGFRTFFVALYSSDSEDNRDGLTVSEKLQLKVGMQGGTAVSGEFVDTVYPTKQLLPEAFFNQEKRFSWIVQPLANREEQLGILILDLVGEEPLVYPSLREQVSCVVQGILLYERQEKTQLRLQQTLKELEAINRVLQDQSFRDELTGLYNRRGFYIVGLEHQKRARTANIVYTLFYIDLDELKVINDMYGHSEGDFAIQTAAKILKRSFNGPSDMVARFGGDEFVALAFGAGERQISSMIRLITAEVDKANCEMGKAYRITLSIGAATWDDKSTLDFDDLLLEADRQLYIKKSRKKVGQCKNAN